MAPTQRKNKLDHEKQKERQREAMRKLRAARKDDPIKYEEEKQKARDSYYKRKEEGKIKIIKEMTERERRQQRKNWRKRSKTYYEKKQSQKIIEIELEDNTPLVPIVQELPNVNPGPSNKDDGRARIGKLRRKENLKRLNNEIKKLNAKLEKERKKKEKYRMRLKRLQKTPNNSSPRKNVEKLIREEKNIISPRVKKNLIFFPASKFNEKDTIVYERWCTKKCKVVIKGIEKDCVKTIKEKKLSTKGEVLELLKESIKPFFLHVRNINHQFNAIQQIKEGLKEHDVLIHMDFSENYNCKYSEEIQSAHFGGSKPQISLHTVVVYFKQGNTLKRKCYCTISENLRHDPIAICAHLKPIIVDIKEKIVSLDNVHFLSDGPATQYRNRKMFFLIGTYLQQLLSAKTIRWHYSEKGHGKGAPDGVGGCLKRTADSLVSRGTDMSDFKSVLKNLQEHCKGVSIYGLNLDAEELTSIEKKLPNDLVTFKGTIQCHEVTFSDNYLLLNLRKLTCLNCAPSDVCEHYPLGSYPLQSHSSAKRKIKYADVYSDEDSEKQDPVEELESYAEILSLQNVKEHDFVVVKFLGKKTTQHFVGVVQECNQYNYLVKFFRKMSGSKKFVLPRKEDISLIKKNDVVCVLPQPLINKRKQYSFSTNLSLFSNIN
ncbi:unnamed protein product [Brassicogethes aeneus]|uniref:Uncharacterized protein n=1 Tax=Brassicogethes aeneus TaxID=1431903 RepID=A0A9P0ARP1_BRAAE|nr:unnamed protein product [Brassicogethes aeneus]